jgi:hypothetical protein
MQSCKDRNAAPAAAIGNIRMIIPQFDRIGLDQLNDNVMTKQRGGRGLSWPVWQFWLA